MREELAAETERLTTLLAAGVRTRDVATVTTPDASCEMRCARCWPP